MGKWYGLGTTSQSNYIYNSLPSEIAINNPLDAPKVDVAQSWKSQESLESERGRGKLISGDNAHSYKTPNQVINMNSGTWC